MAADPFGLLEISSEEDDDSPPCAICRAPLSRADTYVLPECKHEYHTHCIVAWFRHRSGAGYTGPTGASGDVPCPYCGNRGINNRTSRRTRCRYFGGGAAKSPQLAERIRMLREASKRPGAPRSLSALLERYARAKQEYGQAHEARAAYRRKLKDAPCDYPTAQRELHKLRRTSYARRTKLSRLASVLYDYPVVP